MPQEVLVLITDSGRRSLRPIGRECPSRKQREHRWARTRAAVAVRSPAPRAEKR